MKNLVGSIALVDMNKSTKLLKSERLQMRHLVIVGWAKQADCVLSFSTRFHPRYISSWCVCASTATPYRDDGNVFGSGEIMTLRAVIGCMLSQSRTSAL